jgi:hypothetical protein
MDVDDRKLRAFHPGDRHLEDRSRPAILEQQLIRRDFGGVLGRGGASATTSAAGEVAKSRPGVFTPETINLR